MSPDTPDVDPTDDLPPPVKPVDRRHYERFGTAMQMKYRILDDHGFPTENIYNLGRILNVSDAGILIQIEHHVKVGQRIEIYAIPGPAATGMFAIVRIVHVVRTNDLFEVGAEFEVREKV